MKVETEIDDFSGVPLFQVRALNQCELSPPTFLPSCRYQLKVHPSCASQPKLCLLLAEHAKIRCDARQRTSREAPAVPPKPKTAKEVKKSIQACAALRRRGITKEGLIRQCRKLGLKVGGNMAELQQRLDSAMLAASRTNADEDNDESSENDDEDGEERDVDDDEAEEDAAGSNSGGRVGDTTEILAGQNTDGEDVYYPVMPNAAELESVIQDDYDQSYGRYVEAARVDDKKNMGRNWTPSARALLNDIVDDMKPVGGATMQGWINVAVAYNERKRPAWLVRDSLACHRAFFNCPRAKEVIHALYCARRIRHAFISGERP